MAAGEGGQYRINLVWTSHGGQVMATMGQIQSGMRGIGTVSGQSGRQLDYWNRQMMAIGTTMRYFFAGGAIFGTMNAFRQFAEFQSRLGDIAAISPDLSRSQLTGIGDELLRQSSALATPVTELEESARNIQSTLQGLDPSQITHFTDMFAQGARIAESDAYNFGNAIMGMRNAFDLGLNDMQRISGEFFTVISQSAGMTGDEWAKFSGRVVAGAKQAGASLEEMNALMILMTRQGGTAATNARHFAQFLMQLRNPTQESLPFWQQIGLGKQQLQTMPFDAIMQRLNRAVVERGGISADKMSDDALQMAEELGTDATAGQLGIRGGATSLFMNLFGRMESRRAAAVIFSQINQPDRPGNLGYSTLLRNLSDAQRQIQANDQAMARWLDRNRIQQAGIALRNMITEALNPAERVIAGISSGITDIASSGTGTRIVQGGAAALGAYGLFKVLGGGFGAVRGLTGFLRGTGAGALAVSQGSAPPSGSFANPFWVMIHPLSGAGGIGKIGAGAATEAGETTAAKVARTLGPAGLAALGAAGASLAGGATLGYFVSQGMEDENRYQGARLSAARLRIHGFAPNVAGHVGGSRISDTFLRLSGQRPATQGVHISADITDDARRLLNLQVTDESTRKRVHVPVGNAGWSGGTPRFRGRTGTQR